jgi:hypothetical protein
MKIYVELLNEGTSCWRPVEADALGDGRFRIVSPQNDDEEWQFHSGDIVECRQHQFQDGAGLVAYRKNSGFAMLGNAI